MAGAVEVQRYWCVEYWGSYWQSNFGSWVTGLEVRCVWEMLLLMRSCFFSIPFPLVAAELSDLFPSRLVPSVSFAKAKSILFIPNCLRWTVFHLPLIK